MFDYASVWAGGWRAQGVLATTKRASRPGGGHAPRPFGVKIVCMPDQGGGAVFRAGG
ncbi:MAG TPA: hypothetical protein VEF71_04785 [Streptosporangiaceae bacterium]|nr:hypothetical protein [Streptosporangiaceae bacterium]